MEVNRIPIYLRADPRKVILRPRRLSRPVEEVFQFIESMDSEVATREWQKIVELFGSRHRDLENRLSDTAREAGKRAGYSFTLSGVRKLLAGACLAMEYSMQAAALFNPSIVPHFDQSGTDAGSTRFIMSLRAVGEGHISSVEFMEGEIDQDNSVRLSREVAKRTTSTSVALSSRASYVVNFDNDIPLGERVLFPESEDERNGMEDLRLVQFADGEHSEYLGTYTAYDGYTIKSKILRTQDFTDFRISDLRGSGSRGKGIAIFPRRIDGRFAAIGRQDGVNLTYMTTEDISCWEDQELLLSPSYLHDLSQVGNCGSPIETEEGWLLLTHGVGPMRRYTLGVALLDLDDPSQLINYLSVPFMEPLENEREGYVPNVLYTCGWMKHNHSILIPYAMSDTTCSFATVEIRDLLATLKK